MRALELTDNALTRQRTGLRTTYMVDRSTCSIRSLQPPHMAPSASDARYLGAGVLSAGHAHHPAATAYFQTWGMMDVLVGHERTARTFPVVAASRSDSKKAELSPSSSCETASLCTPRAPPWLAMPPVASFSLSYQPGAARLSRACTPPRKHAASFEVAPPKRLEFAPHTLHSDRVRALFPHHRCNLTSS